MSINNHDIEEEEEYKPQLIRSDSGYNLLKNCNNPGYEHNSKYEKLAEYSILSIGDLSNVPGSWLYFRYTEESINFMRFLHISGLGIEFFGLIIGEALIEARDTHHSVTPFSPQHFFILGAWASISTFGVFFLYMLFTVTLTSREIIAHQLGYLIFLVYIFHGIYLTLRNLTEILYVDIICVLLLSVLSILIFILYRRIKYQDDGRFIVNRFEFLGVHVRISILFSWVMLCATHRIFVCLSFAETSDNLLGWSNDNWSILAMCLFFALGVIVLTKYKDIFFGMMISYSFIGIYIMQTHNSICKEEFNEECSEKVGVCAIILSCILFFFILVTIGVHYDLVCYKKSGE
ncbi:unnamed protein product [Blepharisma stoltei]|uniref:Uncharacterized protein n=1 Tax=Blepharisma stoltei TaxID=1481888 RepID=A0AAU9K3Y0_9CILI|nr:unnamed protein product [Blepharisma stoltei]